MTFRRCITMGVSLAVGLSATHAVGAQAAETLLATEADSTSVDIYGGVAAWSSFVPGQGYVLRLYHAGQTSTAPLPADHQPIDFDLGPDERGRVTVVYSRCAAPHDNQEVPVNCRLYRYRVGAARANRIAGVSRAGYSEERPTIWRSRIAFARFRVRGAVEIVNRLFLSDGKHVRQMPRGTLRAGVPGPANIYAEVDKLQLRGRRLAFAWVFRPERCRHLSSDPNQDFPLASEMWLVDTATAKAKRVDHGCSDDGSTITGASLNASGLTYLRGRLSSAPTQRTIRLSDGRIFDQLLAPMTTYLSQDPLDAKTKILTRELPPADVSQPYRYQVILDTHP